MYELVIAAKDACKFCKLFCLQVLKQEILSGNFIESMTMTPFIRIQNIHSLLPFVYGIPKFLVLFMHYLQ